MSATAWMLLGFLVVVFAALVFVVHALSGLGS
jgi:hypothetical protein